MASPLAKCEICERSFNTRQGLYRHKGSHKPPGEYKCRFKECDRVFTSATGRHLHEQHHDKEFYDNACKILNRYRDSSHLVKYWSTDEGKRYRSKISTKTSLYLWTQDWYRDLMTKTAIVTSARSTADPDCKFGKGGGVYRTEYNGKIYSSKLEIKIAEHAFDNNLLIIPYPVSVDYIDLDNKRRKYTIDFLYPELYLFVEVKALYGIYGYLDNKNLIDVRLDAVREAYPNYNCDILLDINIDEQLEHIKYRHSMILEDYIYG
jgi:hypothetical protein